MKKITMPVAIVLSVCIVAVSSLTMFFCSLIDRQEERRHAMIMQASKDATAILSDHHYQGRTTSGEETHGNYYAAGFDVIYNKMQSVK